MKIDFPERVKNPLITLLNGKRACITRLLSPINVPFEKNEYTEYMIRRFVSLIPIYYETSNNNCSKLNGIWLSNNVSDYKIFPLPKVNERKLLIEYFNFLLSTYWVSCQHRARIWEFFWHVSTWNWDMMRGSFWEMACRVENHVLCS